MVDVSAHPLADPNPAAEEAFVRARLAAAARLIHKRPENTGPFFHEALRLIGLRAFLDRPARELADALMLARDLGVGLFLRGNTPGSERVTFTVAGETVTVPGGPTSYVTVPRWLDAWAISRILRDEDAIAKLSAFDVASFEYRESSDAYQLTLVRALQATRRDDHAVDALLAVADDEARNATVAPDRAALGAAEIALARGIRMGADRLEERLMGALQHHDAFRQQPEQAYRPETYLPLLTLALTAWSHDIGVRADDLTSRYLPSALVRGSFER